MKRGHGISRDPLKILVELRGVEPLTSWLPAMRSPN